MTFEASSVLEATAATPGTAHVMHPTVSGDVSLNARTFLDLALKPAAPRNRRERRAKLARKGKG